MRLKADELNRLPEGARFLVSDRAIGQHRLAEKQRTKGAVLTATQCMEHYLRAHGLDPADWGEAEMLAEGRAWYVLRKGVELPAPAAEPPPPGPGQIGEPSGPPSEPGELLSSPPAETAAEVLAKPSPKKWRKKAAP